MTQRKSTPHQNLGDVELMYDLINRGMMDPDVALGMLRYERGEDVLPPLGDYSLEGAREAFALLGMESPYRMAPNRFGGGGDNVGGGSGLLGNPQLLRGIMSLLGTAVGRGAGLMRDSFGMQ